MRQWLTLITISIALAQASWAQLTIRWISQGANLSGQPADSRFPSISADGNQVVFQVGNGLNAQIWLAATQDNDGDGKVDEDPINNIDDDEDGRVDEDPVDWRTFQLTDPQSNQPLLGIHPVISADGNHIAFASTQPYGGVSSTRNKWQIYVLDRLQNRIVPISFLWQDNDGDGMRDNNNFVPSNGNCVPVAISADGRIVVFLAQSLDIVDANGDGTSDYPVNNRPSDWLVLIHDRDADGNGVYDEAGIGATRTFVGSMGNNGNPLPAASVSVSANGRIIAFATPDPDPNNPANPDENWRVIVRDWQNGDQVEIPNAFAPALSDDGTYLAYLTPQQLDNDGDGQVNEDPVDGLDNDNDGKTDEDPVDFYPQTAMDLVVRQLFDPTTGQPLAQIREIRLSELQLPSQVGTADGSAGWGYSDWWGAVTIAVDPTNPNVVYAAFHAWSTDLVDLSLVRSDLVVDGNANTPRLKFYQGVANIFLARFDFTNIDTNPQAPQLWRLTEWTDQQQADKRRGLPVSLEPPVGQQTQYRLTLVPSLLPAVSFVNGNQLAIVFQSLVAFDANDTNGLWDIYLADVLLP